MNSLFKIIALGGLNENGKNCYIIETEKDMVVIEAGSANFSNKSLGIDMVIPDFNYIIKNKAKLRAVLISHGHLDQMGALPALLKEVKVPVYGSYYTIEFLKFYVDKKDHELLKEIKYTTDISIGEMKLEVFSLSHAIFGNFGFVLSKGKDAVCYVTDYNFNQAANKFSRTDVRKIIDVTRKYKVKALITECVSAENRGVAAGNQSFNDSFHRFTEAANGRIIISLYASNLAGMTNVIKMAEEFDKKIVIIGRDLLNYVNIARNLNYISHRKDVFVRIGDIAKHKENLIVVVSGLYENPFLTLEEMATGAHKLVKLEPTDSVLIATKPFDEIEAKVQSILDTVSRSRCSITNLNINVPSHAYQEDIKMMINLVEPEFIIPIKGEYRKQRLVKQLATEIGIESENVHAISNGEHLEIYDEYCLVTGSMTLNDTLIAEDEVHPVNPIILKDREVLSDNGYVLLIMTFFKGSDKLVQIPEIISGGLNQFDDDTNIIEGCRKIVLAEVAKDYKNRELVNKLKSKISRYLQNNIGKTPMVLPVKMEIDPKRVKGK